jgi:hypothetical protein
VTELLDGIRAGRDIDVMAKVPSSTSGPREGLPEGAPRGNRSSALDCPVGALGRATSERHRVAGGYKRVDHFALAAVQACDFDLNLLIG